MNSTLIVVIGILITAFGTFVVYHGTNKGNEQTITDLFEKNQALEKRLSQVHSGQGDNIGRDSHTYNITSSEVNTLKVAQVIQGHQDNEEWHEKWGHQYEVRFDGTKNQPFGLIKITLRIISGDATFNSVASLKSYSTKTHSISKDKRVLTYEIGMLPGIKPVIGFTISAPSTIEISGNYGLEKEIINLNTTDSQKTDFKWGVINPL